MHDPNDLLMGGGGAPSFSFSEIGDTIVGTITRFEANQRREFETNKPLFWDDGNPMMQLVFTLATDLRDPKIEDDDGSRRIYAPISSKPGSMCDAIRTAVRTAGAKQVADGGRLAVRFDGEEAPEKRGRSPRKLYVAQYEPPAATAANDLLGAGQPATQPVQQTAGVAGASIL
jgi:hypothetical protein